MKCSECGSPIKMEDRYCTYCGAENTLAVKHNQDMQRFQKDYSNTKKEVIAKSRRQTGIFSSLILILVLILLNIGAIFFLQRSWTVGMMITYHQIEADAAFHQEKIDTYMQDRSYLDLASHFRTYRGITGTDTFRNYQIIEEACDAYAYIFEDLPGISSPALKPDTKQYRIENIIRNLNILHSLIPQYRNYSFADFLNQENLDFLSEIQNAVDSLLITYCHLSPEDAEHFSDYSIEKQQELIERSIDNGNE